MRACSTCKGGISGSKIPTMRRSLLCVRISQEPVSVHTRMCRPSGCCPPGQRWPGPLLQRSHEAQRGGVVDGDGHGCPEVDHNGEGAKPDLEGGLGMVCRGGCMMERGPGKEFE